MIETNDSSPKNFKSWEGSSVFVEQGRHWSSAFIWLTASLFFGTLIWAFTAKIDQTISVRGQLQPAGSVKDVESPSSGVVLDIYVKDGQRVVAGQDLLTVQAKGLVSRRNSIKQRLLLLDLESKSLLTIIDSNGDPARFPPLPPIPSVEDPSLRSKLITARNQTQQARTQLTQISTRVASKQESLKLERKIADDMKLLFDSGGIARNSYLKTLNRLQELQAEVSNFEAEKSRLIGLIASKLNEINNQIIALTADLDSTNEALSYRTVKAPIAGTIFDMKASPSSVVNNNEVLLKVVPENKLEASVRILDSDIGFVRNGQSASVSIDSFPSGEFGYISGSLQSIGIDVLPPDRENPQRYFPATIKLDQQSVYSGEKRLNLQSGMGVSANIKLRSRPVITILTDIFTKQTEGIKRFR